MKSFRYILAFLVVLSLLLVVHAQDSSSTSSTDSSTNDSSSSAAANSTTVAPSSNATSTVSPTGNVTSPVVVVNPSSTISSSAAVPTCNSFPACPTACSNSCQYVAKGNCQFTAICPSAGSPGGLGTAIPNPGTSGATTRWAGNTVAIACVVIMGMLVL